MPIYDGSLADHYHRQNRVNITRRLRAELAVNNPEELPNWFQAPKVELQMHRRAYDLCNVDRGNAAKLIKELNLNSSQNILIYGGMFGWLEDQIKVQLPGIQVMTIDGADWIHQVKGQDESGEIEANLDIAGVTSAHPMRQQFFDKLIDGPRARGVVRQEDALDNGSRQRIRNLGSFNFIITQNVLSWLYDDECQNLSTQLRKINAASEIVHFVNGYEDSKADAPEPGEILNWKRTDSNAPVVDKLNDLSWYTTPSWQELLPNDRIVGV
ncbi:MAG: hypothetical protein J3T61_10510 [Candidatus Brocadiales bacterium]|nr:hypothetical protein [Candidatus Bathyanammoxibius sp.]